MEKMITRKSDINNMSDLVQYRNQLKAGFRESEKQIKADLKHKVVSLPRTLFLGRKKSDIRDSELGLSSPKEIFPVFGAMMVKKMLPNKMNFLKKWVISFVAKKAVGSLLKKKEIKLKPLVPLPIAMKPNVINQPKEIGETKSAIMPKEKLNFKGIWALLKDSFAGFSDHKVTKISGSLAYYTVFSMAPLMVMVIALCSIFLKKDAAEGQIFLQLKGFLGADTAAQLQDIIKKAAIGDKGVVASIIGGITLLIGATSIFADIQDSINSIWGIKPKPKRGWLKLLQNRFLSFSVIVSLGFLLLVSLGVSALLDGFSNRLQAKFKDVSVIFFYVLNTLITFGVVTSIFAVIFKVLPDAKIRWRDVMAGAMVTAVLFMAGKFGISFYIGKSDVGGTYGAAGSMVILLLWAYYSSIILYFGAEFTKAYAVRYGAEIHPNAYAVTTKEIEVEQGSASVQQTEKSK